jgi:hypothetical protein
MRKNRPRFDPNALKLRDVLVIVPLIITCVVLLVLFSLYAGGEALVRWGGLGIITAVLFGFFVNNSRSYFHNKRFWILTAVLLILHLSIFTAVLLTAPEWKLSWFAITILELLGFLELRKRT